MPEFEYAEWDGSQHFEALGADDAFDTLSEFLLDHGDQVLRQLRREASEAEELLDKLIKAGYLERDESGGLAVSPKGVRRIQDRALGDLFQVLKRDPLGKHDTDFRGSGQVQHDDSRPYRFGDPVANLNLHETLKNAMIRQGGGTPLHVSEDDFVVCETEYQTSCATVLLLDMSGSMARYGKFAQAKRVALALHGLIRGRFPEDTLKTIGFYTYASPLSERELLRAGPKPVSIFDHRVFLRIPLDNPPAFVPEHFTNIQAGLAFARRVLSRDPARNKQIICVTDGEPTAHVDGRELVLIYPPSDRTARATLEEVRRCHEAGIRLSTLALIEDYFYLDLKNFVDQMARLSRGVAVYCTAGELGKYVFDSFVSGRRARRQVG
jgi:Ca-activated chloride channel family protein